MRSQSLLQQKPISSLELKHVLNKKILFNVFNVTLHSDVVAENDYIRSSGVVLKNEVGERLEIEVETVAKSAILQEFCIVRALLFLKLLNVKIKTK